MMAVKNISCLGIVTCSLSACGWAGPMGEENPYLLPEKPGLETFTLVGDLPKDFGLSITGWYGPIDENARHCRIKNLHNEEMRPRRFGKGFDIPIGDKPTSLSRNIPLTYSVGACALELGRVDMEIDGRYGNQRWQKTYADAIFYLHKRLPDGEPSFDEQGTLKVNAACTWLFQESKFYLELSKLLTCRGAGANLQYDQLAGKKVTLSISVNPEERPSHKETWIKFPNGWKPCARDRSGWSWCTNPPTFQTFQMNGKTCTVYPGCVESPSGYAE